MGGSQQVWVVWAMHEQPTYESQTFPTSSLPHKD
jgi:hypothetical protein